MDQYFQPSHDYCDPKKFHIHPTWVSWNTKQVTIMTHHQHRNINSANRLLCVTQEYVRLWEAYMRKWSNSFNASYPILKDVKYDRQSDKHQRTTPNSNEVVVIGDPVETAEPSVDTSDLTAVLPTITELPTVNLPDAQFRDILNIQILSTLQHRHTLHQHVLERYMLLLENDFQQTCFCRHMLNVNFESLMSGFNRKYKPKDFCNQFFFIDNRKTLVFAMNPGMHWHAFKIDVDKRYIATMDSMQNPLNHEAEIILNLISSIYPAAKQYDHFSVNVPPQQNAVDCGPLSCMFMLFLAKNDIDATSTLDYDTFRTAADMRLRIFADIAKGKLTPLDQKR